MRVLAISGSLRRDSHNTRAAAGGRQLRRRRGARALRRPEGDPAVRRGRRRRSPRRRRWRSLREAIARADAVLIATPEYNGSIPGAAEKRARLGLATRSARASLRNKPVAAIGATTGMFGGVWAQAEVRKVLGALGARVIQHELPVARAQEIYSDGQAPAFARAVRTVERDPRRAGLRSRGAGRASCPPARGLAASLSPPR